MRTTAWRYVLLAMVCTSARAEEPVPTTTSGRRDVLKGQAVSSVRSAAKPEQSYALYVPSGYVAERRWPIVYVFDPGAQGTRPLELMKDAAEHHGYVVAASNNSRNGPWQVTQDAAAEMWDDTHRWLSIDDRRVYFAGFSGGARASALSAQRCRCARGVFLVGAGFNAGLPPSRDVVFSVFTMAGLGDFNYGELVELDAQLEGLGFRHVLRRFDGGHTWAPAAEWDDALAWSALFEMKDGLRSRDDAFVAAELAKATERARRREQAGEPAFALGEYRSAAAVFTGLVNTAPLDARIEALQNDPSVRAGVEQEKADIARQRSLEADILGTMDALRTAGGDRITLRAEAALRIRRLRSDLQAEKRPERRRIFERVVGSVFINAMETGRPLLEAGGARSAVSFFELAAEARPDWAWPHLSLARCHGALDDKKAALRDLKRAVETGLSANRLADFVAADAKLTPLTQTEDYKKLLASAPVEKPAP
jgi:tetratricopeptide (TPR) repeat protein